MALQHLATSPVGPSDVALRLHAAGIQPTRQRLAIAQVLLQAPVHMTADDVLRCARAVFPRLSRATVYNTLPLLVDKGLLRALRLDAERTVYDSRTEAHSHLYHADTGLVEDLPNSLLQWPCLPALPAHLELLGLDLIVRVRQRTPELPPCTSAKT